jgi:hypothetical protein
MTPSQALHLTLGSFAAASLGSQARLDLVRFLLQRAQPDPELTLGSASERALAGCDSLGFYQLPLDASQSARELARVPFRGDDATIKRVSWTPRRVLGLVALLPGPLGLQQLGEL